MGMCAIYQEVKKEDFKKLLESDDFFETIEELEEKEEIMEELSEHFENLKEFYHKVAENRNIVVVTIC